MSGKVLIELKNVQETLLLPLWGRAVESQKSNPMLIDNKAVEIINAIDYDFSKIASNTHNLSQLSWIGRALITDKVIREFIERFPEGLIVDIGCGMDTNYERLGKVSVKWFDIDLPEVIDLRKKFFNETPNRKFIPCSILDYTWRQQVPSRTPVLFIAAGVLYYFDEKEVKDFFIRMAEDYHGTEFLFDVASPAGIRAANRMVISNTGMSEDSLLKWGLKRLKDLETWDRDIKIIRKYSFFKDLRKNLSFRNSMGTYLSDFLKIMYMVHLKIV